MPTRKEPSARFVSCVCQTWDLKTEVTEPTAFPNYVTTESDTGLGRFEMAFKTNCSDRRAKELAPEPRQP
ncbi:hypothetical protein PIB30_040828 [Stylosanthes scabra]|uniref:Uncharacterized protein n=1 Tax=Stylosanthes scabra TaxID=79078 RepID=A0ABU6VFU4_9FABA|nr:hypothetical protein [Stylosanthes scabra]